MSLADNAIVVGEVAIEVLEFLAGLTGQGAEAAGFVAVSKAVLHAFGELKAGKLSPEDVRASIGNLQIAIAKNDAAALDALHKKFAEPAK